MRRLGRSVARALITTSALLVVGVGAAPAAHAADGDTFKITLDMAECDVMAVGVTGTCITSLQTWLNIVDGANLNVDAYFGASTERAVRHFQSRFGLTPDGRFGDSSRNALRGWYYEVTSNSVPTPRPGAPISLPLDSGSAEPGLHSGMGYSVATAVVCSVFGIAGGVACSIILDD